MMDYVSDKYKLLEDIDTLAQEKLGIIKLREETPHLYGYYLDWLERKEQRLIKKYRKKYGQLPKVTILTTS